VQIGDLARRVGVGVDTLRAWERRYGLLHPHRSAGGFRLYSSRDEAVVRAMVSQIDRGFPPSQAAKLALAWAASREGHRDGLSVADSGPATPSPADPTHLEASRAELFRALEGFDGGRAQALIDVLLSEFTLNAVLRDVLLPCLQELGHGWARGEVSIAQEHFASQLIRERLLGLARHWDQGLGPRAILACPAHERHDIGLICFGLVLSRSGWRITFLGPDTPVTALAEAVEVLAPDLIVLTATLEERFSSIAEPLRALAVGRKLALAGHGATPEVARASGATLVTDPPVAAATRFAAHPPGTTGPS
jgi:DNA-binding transcriptional MerR regulator